MAATLPTYLVHLPAHVTDWNARPSRAGGDGRAVAVAGAPRPDVAATLHGGELPPGRGCVFEGERDALVFEPPLPTGARYTLAVECKPRALATDERWLVATFARSSRCDSAHVCVLQTNKQHLLGVWDGNQETWHPCEPECDLAGAAGFLKIVAHADKGATTFFVDGARVGAAPFAVTEGILGVGNVPLPPRPSPHHRKQVFGAIKSVAVFADALVPPQKCFPLLSKVPAPRPARRATAFAAETPANIRPPEPKKRPAPVKKKKRRAADDDSDEAPKKKKKPGAFAKPKPAPPPPPPRIVDADPRLEAILKSRVLREHGEEAEFRTAVRSAPRGEGLWLAYEPAAPADGKAFDAFVRSRPHRTVFKFRGEDFAGMAREPFLAELEKTARAEGGAAAMDCLRDKSQMSALFAPAGAGDKSWAGAFEHTTNRVDFPKFCRDAAKADDALKRGDLRALDACVAAGAEAQKVTEWKPQMLRGQTGMRGVPAWFEERSWLPKIQSRLAEVFRPKFALMHAGAMTTHHRDNYGTLTWIKVLGGRQLLATWSMADGDATPGLGDADEATDEGFSWQTWSQLPSARLCLLEAGDVFFMRPGVYHRVFTLAAKVQLFGEFVGAATFPAALRSARADAERPHCLKAADTTIKMRDIFLCGVLAELKAVGESDAAPIRAALALKGDAALRALRALPDRSQDALSRAVGFDADDACLQLLACPGL